MKIPKQLSICGHSFKIIYKKKLICGKIECWGVCDYAKHTIYLKQGMKSTHKMEILIHECIHAIEYINNLNFSEKSVKILALALLGMIRNNKLNFLGK